MSFPDGFLWGAAASAFQIEGATTEDGRGESIWDRFCATPGTILNGDTGDPACDHYHRWRDDLDLMQSLGLQAYRFSIAWPRIQPTGTGAPNRKGLDFYRGLVDGMLERGIRPFATLYHWDLPQALEDKGGWVARDTVERFVEYAELLFDALEGVEDWITHNEPWVAGFLGYGYGFKAPGIADWGKAMTASHHLLLSHGRTVEAFRAAGNRPGRIGITLDMTPVYGDEGAARRTDGFRNRWFTDPVLRGAYPEDMVALYEAHAGPMVGVEDGDLETISAPLDFLGVNFYHPTRVTDDPGGDVLKSAHHPQQPVTAMGWEVHAPALTDLLLRLADDYPDLPPLFITENGAAYEDTVEGDSVDDRERLDYIRRHIDAVGAAIERGVDLRGYFVWSLLDNFEWELGYGKRFGIVYVDYPTQTRIPKRSALWYRDFIGAPRAAAGEAEIRS